MLAEAAQILTEASPAYRDIAVAADPIPTDRDTRAALKVRAEDVSARLQRAKSLYTACRDTDPVVLDRRILTINTLVDSLGEILKRLR